MQRGEREDATGLWWLNEFMKHCTSGIWSVQSQVGAYHAHVWHDLKLHAIGKRWNRRRVHCCRTMHFVKTLEYRKNMQTNTVSLYFLLVVKNRGFRRGSSLSTSHATTETKQDKTWTTVVSQATIDPSVVKRIEAHILERAMAVAAVEAPCNFTLQCQYQQHWSFFLLRSKTVYVVVFFPFCCGFQRLLVFFLKHRKETDVTRATRLDDNAEPQHPVVTLGLPGRDWHVFVDQG